MTKPGHPLPAAEAGPSRRLVGIEFDKGSMPARSPEFDRERRIAVDDLLLSSRFEPQRSIQAGHVGPYRLRLAVEDGRLVLAVEDDAGLPLERMLLGMTRFKRPIRDYFAICASYDQALARGNAHQIEPIDFARRAIHDAAAETLREALSGKVETDFDTARRLFTLIATLHLRDQ